MNNFMVVDQHGKEIFANVKLHPGYVINQEIKARSIKKSIFAKMIGLSIIELKHLIKEEISVSEDLALRLEKALDIDAEFWMRVQVKYNLDKKRLEYAQNNQVMGVSEP
jgi:addiction module HigA family antidote